MPRRAPFSPLLAILGGFLLAAPLARGSGTSTGAGVDAGAAPTRMVQSLFFVAKSENRNQVHYGIRLDRGCAPLGQSPVFAYWRMLERGPLATEPLLPRELAAYGLGQQRVERSEEGGRVVVTLNALPKRPIVIESTPSDRACTATATAVIAEVSARLTSVFVQQRWPFGIDFLTIAGRTVTDDRLVRERVTP